MFYLYTNKKKEVGKCKLHKCMNFLTKLSKSWLISMLKKIASAAPGTNIFIELKVQVTNE